MKKLIAMLLAVVMVLSFAGCAGEQTPATEAPATEAPAAADKVVMTYDEYIAAPLDSAVTIETYVQATQSWWDNKITVYCQSPDGAYFLYELACSEEDAAKLVPGTKILVSGYKGEWAGEVEIMDGTFEFVEGADALYMGAEDFTELLGTDELIKHQNKLGAFFGLTVEAIEYKNGEPGDDIYLTLGYNGASYNFCVERYLTGPETEVYTTVGTLNVGDVVNVEGFLYWYEGVNPHITSISVAESAAMSHEEYIAAELNAAVTIETYVQATQSWWDNKITVYCQSPDGAYFLYELACSEEDAAKLVPGTLIRVNGFKGEWAGEVEVMDGTFEFVPNGDAFIAEPLDVTELLGTEELINHQNELVAFKGLTIEAIEYKNGEPGDDIYVTVGYNGASYSFCVERYLTGPETEVYAAVGALEVGDVVDIEGFLYWYEGVNTHITAVVAAE